MKHPFKNPIFLLWLLYGGFIFYGTLIPFDLSSSTYKGMATFASNHVSKMDLISNFLLFIPWGSLLATLLRHQNGLLNLLLVLTLSFLLSFTVELFQTFSPSRTSWLGDVCVNTLGGGFGWILASIFFYFVTPNTHAFFKNLIQEKPILFVALLIGASLFLGALFPFDISIQISDIKENIKTIHWLPFWDLKNPLFFASVSKDLILFALFAGFLHFSLRLYCLSLKSFFLPAVAATVGLSLTIEGVQLFIQSRMTDSSDFLIALIGGFLGCGVALTTQTILLNQTQNSSSQLRLWLSALYSFFVVYFLLAPLQFHFSWEMWEKKWALTQFVPFYAYWIRTDFYALQDWIFTICLYIPFGALLFSHFKKNSWARGITLGFTFILSLSIEFIQYFQPDRYPDITDLLAGLLGSFLGIWVIKKFS